MYTENLDTMNILKCIIKCGRRCNRIFDVYRLLMSFRQLEKSEKAHIISKILPKYLLGAELFIVSGKRT
jgi:hypothetical protein